MKINVSPETYPKGTIHRCFEGPQTIASQAKSVSSSVFHNETQAGINVLKYCEVRHLGTQE